MIVGNVPSEISFRVAESILASAPLLTSSAVFGSAGIERVGILIAGVLRLLGDEDGGGASAEVVLPRAEVREENSIKSMPVHEGSKEKFGIGD
jgi:hypothetical protein